MIVRCNKCQQDFVPERVLSLWDGPLEVQYYTCTVCGTKYQVLTSDPEMRSIIHRRKALKMQIRAARHNKIPEARIRKIEKRLADVKAKQLKILPALRKRGEEILRGGAHEEN